MPPPRRLLALLLSLPALPGWAAEGSPHPLIELLQARPELSRAVGQALDVQSAAWVKEPDQALKRLVARRDAGAVQRMQSLDGLYSIQGARVALALAARPDFVAAHQAELSQALGPADLASLEKFSAGLRGAAAAEHGADLSKRLLVLRHEVDLEDASGSEALARRLDRIFDWSGARRGGETPVSNTMGRPPLARRPPRPEPAGDLSARVERLTYERDAERAAKDLTHLLYLNDHRSKPRIEPAGDPASPALLVRVYEDWLGETVEFLAGLAAMLRSARVGLEVDAKARDRFGRPVFRFGYLDPERASGPYSVYVRGVGPDNWEE